MSTSVFLPKIISSLNIYFAETLIVPISFLNISQEVLTLFRRDKLEYCPEIILRGFVDDKKTLIFIFI